MIVGDLSITNKIMHKDISIKPNFWEIIKKSSNKYAHIIMIATKPDIIKQAPLYQELKKRWELVVLIHTGQHYDYNLSSWVLNEFDMEVDINLNISWLLHVKYSQIIERLWDILIKLSEECNKIPVPYVHWDTLTATTADKASFLNKFAVVHVEAWIRTFTPKQDFYHNLFEKYSNWKFDWNKYYTSLQDESVYELGSIEPFPEQFDTRSIEASTWFFATPVEFNKKTLILEWFSEKYIKVVWNTISDAINISKTKIKDSKAFYHYPNMKWKPFIFVTVHRRENTEEKERFLAIYYWLKKLIKNWVYVCFLWLNASETAIDNYWLREDIEELRIKYKENFAYWPALAHHSEVIDMISVAWAVVTDSGSMQEEANIVWTPCVTVRFGSDRSETIIDWANIIAPPVNSSLIYDVVLWAIWNEKIKSSILRKCKFKNSWWSIRISKRRLKII